MSRAPDEWWRASLAAPPPSPAPVAGDWYRLGDGYLGVASHDQAFRTRFQELYSECQVPPPGATTASPVVICRVGAPTGRGAVHVEFEDPEPLDQMQFVQSIFWDRALAEVPEPFGAWRLLTQASADAGGLTLAFTDDRVVVRHGSPWQPILANLAANRVFRLQRNTLFLHAASVGIRGSGVLLVGPKGAGKTTVSLAAAARGHSFLGDEIAAIRLSTLDLLPVRRATSVKPGPRSEAVASAVRRIPQTELLFPDGSRRLQAPVGSLFPAAEAAPHPLALGIFLRGFARQPRLEPLTPDRSDLKHLTPLAASCWATSPGRRAWDCLRLLTEVRWAGLDVGDPDHTVDLLERAVERQ